MEGAGRAFVDRWGGIGTVEECEAETEWGWLDALTYSASTLDFAMVSCSLLFTRQDRFR